MKRFPQTFDSIERLEDRIAPANLVPGGKIVTFIDSDGDNVTVTFSKAVLTAGNVGTIFTFSGSAFNAVGPQKLTTLDVHTLGATANGVDISVRAARITGGNGAVDVGGINASDVNLDNGSGTGIDLGKVFVQGNINYIDAGDTHLDTLAIKSLDVRTLGAVSDGVQSAIYGGVGTFKVRGDLQGYVHLDVAFGDKTKGSIKTLIVGGSVGPGFDSEDAGRINVIGGIATATIKHDVRGGPNLRTGYIGVGFDVGVLSIGGSVLGGSENYTGVVSVGGKLGKLTLRGDLAGGSSGISGLVTAGSITTATITGSIRGYSEPVDHFQQGVGTLSTTGNIGSLTIGSLLAGNIAAGIAADTDGQFGTADDSSFGGVAKITRLVIRGTVNGTINSDDSFGIEANQFGSVQIGSVVYKPTDPKLSFSTGFFISPTNDVKLRTL